jgi:hypothetical protein
MSSEPKGSPRSGNMKLKRTILHSSALIGSLCGGLCALPPATAAGPLLSGYGGPGAGAQTILGAALLNGPAGGSGGGSGTSSGNSAGSPSNSPSRGSRGGTRGHGGAGSETPAGRGGSDLTSSEASVSEAGEAGIDTSWFSGRDLAAAAFVAAALALVAAATMRLARGRDEIGGRP